MPVAFNEIDRLILERWTDVTGLLDAHRAIQDRLEEQIELVTERVARWARPLGFEVDCSAKDAEMYAWRPAWHEKRRDEAKVSLVLGAFCPIGFRRVEDEYPYLFVYSNLEEYRFKEPERIAFAHTLRTALAEKATNWECDGIDDDQWPLGRYLTQYDNSQRARLIADSDALYNFAVEHFPTLFALADVIEAELKKLDDAR